MAAEEIPSEEPPPSEERSLDHGPTLSQVRWGLDRLDLTPEEHAQLDVAISDESTELSPEAADKLAIQLVQSGAFQDAEPSELATDLQRMSGSPPVERQAEVHDLGQARTAPGRIDRR
jgi:hypothetical protein